MISSDEHTITISPIGNFDRTLLKSVAGEVTRTFGYQVEISTLLHDLSFALDPERRQYNSTLILDKLATLAPSHTIKVLAITSRDLFIPILTYVYGEAQLDGKTCIISTHRLLEGISPVHQKVLYHQRVAKEAIHELGHTFNLRHCKNGTCIMHYCRSIKDVDYKSDQFCRYCNILTKDEIIKLMGSNRL